ncbi:C40 family peptidase [Enterococcus raffinosus]|uniref:glucosaminidase domain-containing protein n=1 Tax=Enterococcus raffinosus TaxID=71452 RepID=UPI001C1250D8|nr:glucosaminidase domain-containing protein [Enterococcus raffinosus]MBU5362533.1 C40 family peptidase [Enterococcus raffinosus]
MKYTKWLSILAIGAILGSTALSSYQVFAEENNQSSATFSETQATTDSSGTSMDAISTESSDSPAVAYKLVTAEGKELINNTLTDANGNKVTFQLSANNKVCYTVTLAKEFTLKEVKFVNVTTKAAILVSPTISGQFSMPESNVAVEFTVTKINKPVEKPVDSSESKPQTSESSSSTSQTDQTSQSSETAPSSPSSQTNENKQTTLSSEAQTPAAESTETTASQQQYGPREPSDDAAATAADVRIPSNQAVPTFSNEVQTAIVQEAYRHLGKPYVWGAKGPNAFDCSGLAYAVYANATGHYIGGWTGDQQFAGTQIPVSEAQPGDLLFWGAPTSVTTHVAIYIGNGQYVHAPQPGDVVKIGSISSFAPTFAVRVNIAGLPEAASSLANSYGEYSVDQPFIFNKNQTTDQFIEKIGKISREIGQKNGIYSSVMIAQAILERGSGNSALASEPNYNLFGIKGQFKEQGVTFQTLEQDKAGASFQITSEFRKYPSYKESLEDYAKLLKKGIAGNEDFYKGAWKDQAETCEEATAYLQGRYATDKQYAEKLNAIIEAYDLTEFDEADEESSEGPVINTEKSMSADYDRLQKKLILSVMKNQQIPQVMSAKQFVSLFRGESLIALAATAAPVKSRSTVVLSATASFYHMSGGGLLAVLPPMDRN